MKRELRIGVAGLGRIFDLHLRGYRDEPDARIVAVFDADPEELARRATSLGDVKACSTFEELLNQDLDLVEILTPHPVHAEQTVAAFVRGVHVSVQKPMALTLADADRMISAGKAAGRHLRVFEHYRFYAPLIKARELIREGAIGRPLHCRLRTVAGDPAFAWPVKSKTWQWRAELFERKKIGRLTFDDGHHRLATALWFFGPVKDVFARIETTQSPGGLVDAPASITWRHIDPPVHVIWDVIYAPRLRIRTDYYAIEERFEITGETEIITVNRATGRILDEPVLTLYRDGELRAFHNIETDWGSSFAATTRDFLSALRDGSTPRLTGEEGRAALSLGLAVAESGRAGSTSCGRSGARRADPPFD